MHLLWSARPEVQQVSTQTVTESAPIALIRRPVIRFLFHIALWGPWPAFYAGAQELAGHPTAYFGRHAVLGLTRETPCRQSGKDIGHWKSTAFPDQSGKSGEPFQSQTTKRDIETNTINKARSRAHVGSSTTPAEGVLVENCTTFLVHRVGKLD